jgi:riboflavin synthase
MFTGLVQAIGTLTRLGKGRVSLQAALPKPELGESISINGVCLTVTRSQKAGKNWNLDFDLSPETLKKTNFSSLKIGSRVNIERCVTPNTLLGGHIVQGHVDGVGRVHSIGKQGANREMTIKGPLNLLRYVVEKGSVTVNGVSLTAINVKADNFSIALIPHTLRHTNLGNLKVGDSVNLEADVLAKYVEKLIKRK